MKKTYAEIVICATVLALLAVPAAVSAQDRLTDAGIQLVPSRPISSVGPVGGAELKHTAASTEVLATVYTNRATFDAAFPGLPIEDFQDFTDAITGCDAPANNTTSCPGGYNVGDILPGLEIDCTLSSGPGLDGLVIIPTLFDGNDTIEFGSNTFDDNTIIKLDPPVDAVGFDIACHFGSPQVDILVYDGTGVQIWAGNYSPCDPTGAFVGWSADVPEGIGRIELNDPTGASVESLDDIAFGDDAAVVFNVYPTRVGFDAANPGLPIEDFQDFTDAITGCDAPANSGTSCPDGYNAGDILHGLEIDCTDNTGPGLAGLVIVPTGFDGNDSTEFGSNTFTDNTIINLDPPVDAIGFDIACHFGSPQVDIGVFDGIGGLLWFGNHVPCDPTGFFLGWDTTAPEGIGRIELTDPSGVSIETVDDIAFPSSGAGLLIFADGFESGDTSVWSSTTPP